MPSKRQIERAQARAARRANGRPATSKYAAKGLPIAYEHQRTVVREQAPRPVKGWRR